MKSERKAEIKVGITTLLSLVIFVWLMGWAKNFVISSDDIELSIMFENVSGLEIDDDVTVRGLRKGFVKDIYLDRNVLLVKISLDKNVDLREDAQFLLATMDLMGGKKIEILPGYMNELLDMEVIHSGIFLPDLSSLMETIADMKDDLITIVKDVKVTLENLNVYLGDQDIKADVSISLNNLRSLTGKIDRLLSENSENISAIIGNTAELTGTANKFFNENKDDLSGSIEKLRSVLERADSLVDRFNFVTAETLSGENNLGKFLYNDSLMTDVTSTLSDLKTLLKLVLIQMQEDGVKVDANIW